MKQTDSDRILALDNHCCQHPGCNDPECTVLDVHEIKFRSEGGKLTADNQITLGRKHHKCAHEGRKVDGVWQSGRQYMISVLDTLALRVPFRWRAVRRWLKDCEARKRVGEKV